MLTYDLKKSPGVPLYEALYRCIRADILNGTLRPGQKLPSKRTLCANLKVSKITVETAYQQLLEEGYLRSEEKIGYFVEAVDRPAPKTLFPQAPEHPTKEYIDLTQNTPAKFPFSVWSKLQRQVVLDLGEKLLLPMPNQGLDRLRQAIAEHLWEFRGMQVDPQNILIGAGTDFLYNLLLQLLGREKCYAVEEPGYSKIRRIYNAAGASCVGVPLDKQGVRPEMLGNAQILHISPSHHFPSGIITPLARRQELLSWAKEEPDRWIIEDDYDSEFRFAAHPLPAMQSLSADRVIYINTFSKTLAPSIRISYMVLPQQLMELFRKNLGFYSCTVPSFEQHTLARFLQEGHFEKHINRMRKFYKSQRNRLLSALNTCPFAHKLSVLEEDAGLHFLLQVDTRLSDDELVAYCEKSGILVQSLCSFYSTNTPADAKGKLVINYSGLTESRLTELEEKLHNLV